MLTMFVLKELKNLPFYVSCEELQDVYALRFFCPFSPLNFHECNLYRVLSSVNAGQLVLKLIALFNTPKPTRTEQAGM